MSDFHYYSRSALETSLLTFLEVPTTQNRNIFYQQALFFAQTRAYLHLKAFAGWWLDKAGWVPVDDLQSYFLEKLLRHLEGPRFKKAVWTNNPMGCLHTFFHSRAVEFLLAEGLKAERHVRIDTMESGWEEKAPGSPSVEDAFLEEEHKKSVGEAVAKLPGTAALIYQAKFELGMKSREIAEQLGLPVNQVYAETARLKKLLATFLADE